MGEAGIEINTIALFDDVFPVSMKKLHRSLENKEELFAFVLRERFLLRLKRKGQDEGFQLPKRTISIDFSGPLLGSELRCRKL